MAGAKRDGRHDPLPHRASRLHASGDRAASMLGCQLRKPDFIIADSGSCDIGPYPLGADGQASPTAWQRHDLEVMLLAARRLGVPMIIGSASDTGTDRGVDQFVRVDPGHRRASTGWRRSSSRRSTRSSRRRVARALAAGTPILGLDGRPDADAAVLDRTDRAVAVMGAEPMQEALRAGAEVVIAGRSSDCAIFAAPLLNAGFSPADRLLRRQADGVRLVLREPFMGKETIFGRISGEDVYVTAMHPGQRCTPASVASHSMYERRNPVSRIRRRRLCRHDRLPLRAASTRRPRSATGAALRAVDAAGSSSRAPARSASAASPIVGIRDPYMIANIDRAIAWAQAPARRALRADRDRASRSSTTSTAATRVMGELEPDAARGAARARHRRRGRLHRTATRRRRSARSARATCSTRACPR